MHTPEEIASLDISSLKVNFFVLMSDVVTTYGDDQVFPLVCAGQDDDQVSLPGEVDQTVRVYRRL